MSETKNSIDEIKIFDGAGFINQNRINSATVLFIGVLV